MLDDPLGLIVQGIAVLAAGMYPVGFLFGACSDCCQCQQPCNYCTQPCNTDTLVNNVRFDMEVAGYQFDHTDFELWDGPEAPWSGRLLLKDSNVGVIAGSETEGTGFLIDNRGNPPQGKQFLLNHEWPACITPDGTVLGINVYLSQVQDACGCPVCGLSFAVGIAFGFAGGGNVRAQASVFPQVQTCSATTFSVSSLTIGDWQPAVTESVGDVWNSECDCGGDLALLDEPDCDALSRQQLSGLVKTWLDDNFTISVTNLEIDTCECGPCCHAEETINTVVGGELVQTGVGAACTENVSQGRCENNTIQTDSTWLGVNATCDECPIGSCCDAETGECSQTFEEQCDGTWTLGESCEPNPCPPPPTGACCDANGNCTQTTDANCQGTWTEGVECEPNPCPPPTGACCDNEGNCTQTTQANCQGTWSQGVACNPDPCNNDNGWCCMYQNGLYLIGYPATQAECVYDGANSGPDVETTWTPGGEIECPETP